ncbi:hypothetical protein H0274_01565 [Altererythrobacter sp. CC-YST694]|uniref:hypothetical protein n=1 Tax=Altererythrobacter sp. CC-YST694 TaxID=2755038 RepID=UPI001D0299C5|nr:hypothetical protein [Altererythrobacter sp. CC-YST694]MCB5423932.1 hypothetical protein [Altererythrobacter sp. CC-YST694]
MSAPSHSNFIGLDFAKGDCRTAFTFSFICGGCGVQNHSPRCERPAGWQFIPGSRDGDAAKLLCPDCRPNPNAPSPQARSSAFALYLEKQPDGAFHIAMSPEQALMRWLPLGFFLTPAQAREMARELQNLAALAERPGSIPAIGKAYGR